MSEVTKSKLFQRQTTLQEIGNSGQEALQNASVAIIGCGGLGSVAAIYLAASGVGNLHLVDFDTVDISNLHRQVFYTLDDVGKSKAEVLGAYIGKISPFVKVTYSKHAVSKSNAIETISRSEIVLDCTDVLPVKYLLNDVCVLQDKVLVYGSLYKFDGYAATFNHVNADGSRSTNLRDAFPEIPTDNIPNCSQLGTLNTIVGIIGLLQANEVLKIVTGVGEPLTNQLLIYNSSENSQFQMKLNANFSKEKIQAIYKTETYEQVTCEIDEEIEMSQTAFKDILENSKNEYSVVSVIENVEQELPFAVDEKVPLSEFEDWIQEGFEESQKYIFVCNRGIMSMTAAINLIEDFPDAVAYSLEGGILDY